MNLKNAALKAVFDQDKIALVMDHFTPNKDIKAAEQCQAGAANSPINTILSTIYDVGRMGIEHALLPEQGLVVPGDCVIGADSHTCTYGALGAFSTGVGSTDMAAGMMTGKAWFKVPGAIKFDSDRQACPVGQRQGRDPAYHRDDRRGRRPVSVHGVRRRRGCSTFPWTTGSASPTWPLRPARKTAFSRWTT